MEITFEWVSKLPPDTRVAIFTDIQSLCTSPRLLNIPGNELADLAVKEASKSPGNAEHH